MLGRFLSGKLGRTTFLSVVASFTSAMLAACIHVRISMGVPIGIGGVAAGLSFFFFFFFFSHVTPHAA